MSKETRETSTPVVWVFGGGITGLSVAHECIERGYEVYLVEPSEDSWDADLPAVGGLARTQWAYIPTSESDAKAAGAASGEPRITRALPFVRHPSFEFTLEEIRQVRASVGDVQSKLWRPIDAELTSFVRRAAEATRGAGYQALTVVLHGPMDQSVITEDGEGAESAPTGTPTEAQAEALSVVAQAVRNAIVEQLNRCIESVQAAHGEAANAAAWAAAKEEKDILWDERLKTFRVEVRVAGRGVVPGEHGFRYFPGFYRHLFDTMRRTPILQPGADRFGPAVRTVFDNLVSTEATWLVVSPDDKTPTSEAPEPVEKPKPAASHADDDDDDDDDGGASGGERSASRQRLVSFPRRPPQSIQQTLKLLESFVRELGYSAQDVSRISTKLFQYMTSSTQRREAEFEDLTWWDFIEGERFTETCRRHMELGPEVLGAMTASESETRTQGNCVTQLLIDQLAGRTITDATLNGPTSVAWFDPWRDYLIYRGVKFLRGALVDFEEPDPTSTLHMPGVLLPKVLVDGERMPSENFDTEERSHYFVIAAPLTSMLDVPEFNLTPSDQLRRGPPHPPAPPERDPRVVAAPDGQGYGLARKFERAMVGVRATLDAIDPDKMTAARKQRLSRASDITALTAWQALMDKAETPRYVGLGPLRHLTGVQYLFDNNIQFGQEHTLYMDAPWRLSSISQAHFWRRRPTGVYGYRGIVSVDIGALHRPAEVTVASEKAGVAPSTEERIAWKCNADEIAHAVWEQVRESIAVDTQGLRRVTSEAANDSGVGGRVGTAPLGVEQWDPRASKPRKRVSPSSVDVRVGGAKNLVPSCYHLDESIIFFRDPGAGRGIAKNLSPYLINRPGEWKLRPGRVNPQDEARGYAMQNGCWVLAGTYMKTFTRLTTMESANESARHAVNAILRASGAPGDRCKIWNPEEMELPDFVGLKQIDQKLFEDGYPHMVEILGLDAIPEALLPRQLNLDEDPHGTP